MANWDKYHGIMTEADVVEVINEDGYNSTCAVDALDDFTLIDGKYVHNDIVATCPHCGRKYDSTKGTVWSSFTGEEYCCLECKWQAEQELAEYVRVQEEMAFEVEPF